jgi:hypothetical protein
LPAIEAMLTIRPYPAAVMTGRHARVQWNTPVRLTAITRCQASGG